MWLHKFLKYELSVCCMVSCLKSNFKTSMQIITALQQKHQYTAQRQIRYTHLVTEGLKIINIDISTRREYYLLNCSIRFSLFNKDKLLRQRFFIFFFFCRLWIDDLCRVILHQPERRSMPRVFSR